MFCPNCGIEIHTGWGRNNIAEVLKEAGRERRQMGVDALAARILDALEAGAREEGSAEYILSRRDKLIIMYVPPELHYLHAVGVHGHIYTPRTEIDRVEAIRLLLESRTSQVGRS